MLMVSRFYRNHFIISILFILLLSFSVAQTGFTQITDWDSIFGGNVTAEGFYEYDGTYVIPIYKVNWSDGVNGDLQGMGLNATVKVQNLNYKILVYWENITNAPTDVGFFYNDVGYITMTNLTVYENLSQFINDVGYALITDLTWNNITGKPTMISYWQNDVGYITMLNLSELQQQVQILNQSLQNESFIRNQTDDVILSMINIIYNDLQDEINARISGDSNLSLQLNNLNISLSAEINNLYAGISSLNTSKSGIGNCPAGFVVQNLTTGSPQCVGVVNSETDPIFSSQNQSIWLAIWDRMLITDQRYNDTALIYQIEGNLYTSIDNLNLTLQAINQTLQTEIQDRINADNSLNQSIQDVSTNISIETQARIQNDSYILSKIPYVYGDNIFTYSTTDGQNFTVNFNDTKLNQTIEQLTGIFEENVSFTTSGGNGNGITINAVSGAGEILEIAVFPTTITNNYKFSANTSITGQVIDKDRATHTGNWIIAHAGSVVINEKITYFITNANINELFRVRVRWQN